MMKEGGAMPDDRLRYGFRLVTGPRAHRPRRAQILRDSLHYHLDYFATRPEDDTEPFLKQGEAPSDPALEPARTGGIRIRGEPDAQPG